jgi:hypothetical protein
VGWVDVVQDGHAVRSDDFRGVKACPGIRKKRAFQASGGSFQLSGAKKAGLKVAVLTLG